MGKHKHHIIPVYHCKELGIDPDFDENIVEVDRLDHARIHWGYKCDDLEPLFEYITPAQWIIDLIPRGDSRDVGAAVLTAKGELDGIDMSGENNPMYGKKNTEEQKEHKRQVLLKQWQIPIEDGGSKGWKPTEEMNRHNSETKKQLYAAGILVPSMKGKTQSEETKKKIGDKARGRTHSEETKRKMSEAHKGIKKPWISWTKDRIIKSAMTRRALTQEQYQMMQDLRKSGYTRKQISEKLQVSFDVVKKWVNRPWDL